MFEIHPGNWPVAIDASDPRNQFHERAMREAQTATDWRGWSGRAARRPTGLVERLRIAFAGEPRASASEHCACPA